MFRPVFLITVLAGSAPALAQTAEPVHSHMMHVESAATALPLEPGQGAFAAIQEIITLLEADPATDWTLVDIDALREHLLDMDRLIGLDGVRTEEITGGLLMAVPLAGPAGAAAMRMLPMHAPVLEAESGWQSELESGKDELVWRVTSPTDTARIRALGFFGLMAKGTHHQPHHLALARGTGHP